MNLSRLAARRFDSLFVERIVKYFKDFASRMSICALAYRLFEMAASGCCFGMPFKRGFRRCNKNGPPIGGPRLLTNPTFL
ncbi:hypothetical protein X989_5420 [Burkholderia pseudomallei MSHR4378]|nr:hypothetical protein X989_5420 [Burkholderia pseudomallei MSHR4378]